MGQPSNASIEQLVEFHADPRGGAMFRRLAGVHARGITGREPTTPPVVERTSWWHGRIHASPQRFMGQAAAGKGSVPPVHEVAPELGDTRSAGLEDPAQRLIRERAARRQR